MGRLPLASGMTARSRPQGSNKQLAGQAGRATANESSRTPRVLAKGFLIRQHDVCFDRRQHGRHCWSLTCSMLIHARYTDYTE